MTADNVEQLMDIVRALQQGEEPDPKKRKQAQQTEEQSQEQGQPQVRTVGTKKKATESEDEFEQILDDDSTEEFQRGKKAVAAVASRASGLLEGWKEKQKQNRERREEEKKKRRAEEAQRRKEQETERGIPGEVQETPEEQPAILRAGSEDLKEEPEVSKVERQASGEEPAFTKAGQETRTKESAAPKAGQETRTKESAVLKEGQEEPAEESAVLKAGAEAAEEGSAVPKEGSESLEKEVADPKAEQSSRAEEKNTAAHSLQQSSRERRRRLNHMEQMLQRGEDEEETGTGIQMSKHSGKDAPAEKSSPKDSDGPDTPMEKEPADESEKKEKPVRDIDKSGRLSERVSGVSAGIRDRLDHLGQKGIHSKELIMLAAVVMFAVLLILIAVSAVRGSLERKQKSRNVTADQGLVVMVEDEPSSWCSSYPVQLKMYVKNEAITSVLINGTTYQPDENGLITVNADDWILDAEVKTESTSRKARIELEYLDGDAPVLEIKKEDTKVILTAVDARSSVEDIYYAETGEDAYFELPLYQKYTGALTYKEGTVYRFYTRDKAGNCSSPVVSTLEDAESFSLNQTEAALFPGESFGLGVKAEPEGALLKNVNYESMDSGVISVEQNGKVTAVGNGTAAVRVTAAGMESQTCTVTVSEERTVTVSTIGDCTLGTDQSFNTSTSFNAFDAVNGHAYFFQNVRDILSQDDVTFANLEGTLTDSGTRENKQYAFKGDPSYTEVLTSGSVEVVTLANNHSSDYGTESLTDTELALTEAGIDYCLGDNIAFRSVNGIKMAFIGIYVLDVGMERESQVKETIARARKQGAKLVIVAFHWGSEKQNYPDDTQVSLAHTAVDSGADLVVGHHPHVLQGIEKYNGKYIVYSLANFCFGGNSAPSDMDTIIFQQTFTVSAAGVKDSDDISIIPCRVSSASGYNNYQPTPVTGTDAEQIISRLNEYSAAYGQTYTAAAAGQ